MSSRAVIASVEEASHQLSGYRGRCMLRMCRAYAASKPTKSLYASGLEATRYDGTAMPLSSLEGKVSIVVNVASR